MCQGPEGIICTICTMSKKDVYSMLSHKKNRHWVRVAFFVAFTEARAALVPSSSFEAYETLVAGDARLTALQPLAQSSSTNPGRLMTWVES